MSQTLLEPSSTPSPMTTSATADPDRLAVLEQRVEQQATRRDGWTVFVFTFAALALLVAVVAVGFPGPVDEAGTLLAAPTLFGPRTGTVDLAPSRSSTSTSGSGTSRSTSRRLPC